MTQGTSQTVNFKYDAGTVLIGGAFDDQFLGTGDGCSVTAVSVNAPDNPVNASTITSITFAPTVAVCGQVRSVGSLRTAARMLQWPLHHAGQLAWQRRLKLCLLQFIDNSVGNLALIAFDTTTATTTSGYSAYACKFTLQFTLVPQSADSVNPAQLFPEANAAEAIPGNFLKVAHHTRHGSVQHA